MRKRNSARTMKEIAGDNPRSPVKTTPEGRKIAATGYVEKKPRLPIPDPGIVGLLPEEYPWDLGEGHKNLIQPLDKQIGRYTGAGSWDRVKAAQVIQMLAQGLTFASAERGKGMPSRNIWNAWVAAVPELKMLYKEAKKAGAAAFADEAVGRARQNADAPDSEVTNASVRIAVDALKWGAGKLDPETFGDKADGRGGITINIKTNLDFEADDPVNGGRATVQDTEEMQGVYTVVAPPMQGTEGDGLPNPRDTAQMSGSPSRRILTEAVHKALGESK